MIDGHERSVNASTLQELRKREKDLKTGKLDRPNRPDKPGKSGIRYSSNGEKLNEHEYEVKKNGQFEYRYKDGDKWASARASTLDELRIIEKKIEAGIYVRPSEINKDRHSSKGELLRKYESVIQGRYIYGYTDKNGKRRRITASTLDDLRTKEEALINGHYTRKYERMTVRHSKSGELLRRGEYEHDNGGFCYQRQENGVRTIEVHAPTLPELRKKYRNILSGHPERNYIRKSSKGETLYKGESERSDGRFYYTYKDETGIQTVSAKTVEGLRVKEKNIEEGHPERNKERYSSKGELLGHWEVEDKNGGYWGWGWNEIDESLKHFHALTLEELRTKRDRVEQGLPSVEPIIRKASNGEILNIYEYELSDGTFVYSFHNRSGSACAYAETLDILRIKEQNITTGHPEWNRSTHTKDGKRLFSKEDQFIDGKVVHRIDDRCYMVADDLDYLREQASIYYMGLHRDETREGRYTVYEYFELFFGEKKLEVKFHTYAQYKQLIDRYLRDSSLGCTFLDEVTRSQVREFVNGVAEEIRKKYPGRRGTPTANSIRDLISQLYSYADDDGLVSGDPAGKVKVKECEQIVQCQKRRALDDEEQKRLRESIKGKYYEPHIMFLLCTGIRCTELLGLTWDDIDIQENRIQIKKNMISFTFEDEHYIYTSTPKTKWSRRGIPLTRNIKGILEMVKERCKPCQFKVDGYSNFIFTDEKGELLSNSKLNSVINKYVKEANKNKTDPAEKDIPSVSCHSLRHTYLTNLAFRIHLEPSSTQMLAGHASIETTYNIYADVQPDMLDEAGEMICEYYEELFGENKDKESLKKITGTLGTGEQSAIAAHIRAGKQYGASMEQVCDGVAKEFRLDRAIAADIVNGFWGTYAVGAI